MAAENSTRSAFDALTAALGGEADKAVTPDQRATLVAFAEGNISQKSSSPDQLNKLALGRVQALYVAGSLATIDGAQGKNPFADPELAKVYQQQQRYMQYVQERLEGKTPKTPDRGGQDR